MLSVIRRKKYLPLVIALALPSMPAASETISEMLQGKTKNFYAELYADYDYYKEDREALNNLVEKYVANYFDWRRMSRFVLSRHWKKLSKEQKDRFVDEFHRRLLGAYSRVLLDYRYEQYEFLPDRKTKRENVFIVRSITRTPTKDIKLKYYAYKKDDEVKIIDVSVQGISLLINYRKAFAQTIKAKGFDYLLETLTEQNRKSSEGRDEEKQGEEE